MKSLQEVMKELKNLEEKKAVLVEKIIAQSEEKAMIPLKVTKSCTWDLVVQLREVDKKIKAIYAMNVED